MKIGNCGLLLICCLLATGCGDPTEVVEPNPLDEGTVVGQLVFQGETAASVPLELGGVQTTTDSSGRFEFRNIEDGDHDLSAMLELGDAGFVARTWPITVDGSLSLGEVTLPEPVNVEQADVTTGTVSLAWSASEDEGFREYKIYVHNSTALDETTGTLLHVATGADQTTFTHTGMDEPLSSNTTYYYRVYVMDESGLLGGSNILEATTLIWDVEEFQAQYVLVEAGQLGSEDRINGLTHTDECLWIVHFREIGSYYDNNAVRLSCHDHESGEITRSFDFMDDYTPPSGLTYDGEMLWLNYTSTGAGERAMRAIDPESGEIVRSISTPDGVHDLAFDGENLLLNSVWNQVTAVDPTTGAIVNELETVYDQSMARGIAYVDGEIWLTGKNLNQLAILDDRGQHISVAHTDLLDPEWNYADDLYLEWVGEQLALVKDGRVYFLDVEEHQPM